ncbi:MAG TPA: YceI family protein [Oligoflexia bacterium]|nr:YceI family protein [Oligoflexia bacterium]
MKRLCLFACMSVVVFLSEASAQEAFWHLPHDLNDRNTTIIFEVDSTWHLIEGKTSGMSGKVYLADPADYRSVRVELSLPVSRFDTDNSMRDSRLREVMAAAQFPYVMFALDEVENVCDPVELAEDQGCSGVIKGRLTIREITKKLEFPAEVRRRGGAYIVAANAVFRWGDFGVEDPSILVAKLKPEVTVRAEVKLESSGEQTQP